MQAGHNHRRPHTPRRHGELLIDPPWPSLPHLLEQNHAQLQQANFDLSGRPACPLRHGGAAADVVSRTTILESISRPIAAAAARPLGPSDSDGTSTRIVSCGRLVQELRARRTARRTGALAVHLVIDNDVCKSTALRIPTGSIDQPRLQSVAFDRPLSRVPLEERPVVEADRFASFATRAAATIRPFVEQPLLRDYWPRAVAAAARTQRLGLALAQMRHQVEAECGLQTLELPLSTVCDAEPFSWFVAHLLLHAARFLRMHNEALLEHRRVNRIRSRTHPVPDLQQRHAWCETPLWIWDTHRLQRQRLLVRQHQGQLQLWDLSESSPPRPVGRADDATSVVAGLTALRQQGIKIRPRALTTTLYARLFLCDLFVHGIGGAKYDELTDVLMERLFGLPAPTFVTATATVHLPIEPSPAASVSLPRGRQLLREMHFHPERHLSTEDRLRDEVAFWVRQKSNWLDRETPRSQRSARHAAIVDANAALQAYVQPQRQSVEAHLQRAATQLRQQQILASRDYAYCLFPLPMLRDILGDSLHASH